MIFVTDKLLKPWQAGRAIGPFIFMRQGYETDKARITHEKAHVKQWLHTTVIAISGVCLPVAFLDNLTELQWAVAGVLFGLSFAAHHILMQFSTSYQYACEIQAYRAQFAIEGTYHALSIADDLITKYEFTHVTKEQAYKDLMGH